MTNYETYTLKRKTHWNEYAPDVRLEFTTHQEDNLDEVMEMLSKFLIACGYSETAVKQAMNEFGEY